MSDPLPTTPAVPAGPASSPPAGPWVGALLCSAAMATVGTSVVASKLIGARLEPFAATALRHALALPVLLLLCAVLRPDWPRPCGRDVALLLLQAAAGSVGYTVLLIAGTSMASATDAGVVAGTLPAMAALFAFAVLGERPGARAWAGIALATVGVMLLAFVPSGGAVPPDGGHRLAGIVLVLGAVASEVVFILGQRRLQVPVHPLAMATLMSAGGLLLSLPVAWAVSSAGAGATGPTWAGAAPALAAVAWYAWVPTVIGFWLWYAGARRASATQAAVSTAWLPVFAVAGSATVLGERLHARQGLALLLVLAGMLLSAWPGRSTRPAAAGGGATRAAAPRCER